MSYRVLQNVIARGDVTIFGIHKNTKKLFKKGLHHLVV